MSLKNYVFTQLERESDKGTNNNHLLDDNNEIHNDTEDSDNIDL